LNGDDRDVTSIAFLEALELSAVDLVGCSIGSLVAQEIALIRPALVRRLVLASSAPRGAAGMRGWAPLIPQARIKIYPDVAHGFLFQHHGEFSRDVDAFLRE
jgi:pimeloyl-ACP methyl ester carboxylesterase